MISQKISIFDGRNLTYYIDMLKLIEMLRLRPRRDIVRASTVGPERQSRSCDPLSHPDIRRMTPHEVADLPLRSVEILHGGCGH